MLFDHHAEPSRASRFEAMHALQPRDAMATTGYAQRQQRPPQLDCAIVCRWSCCILTSSCMLVIARALAGHRRHA
jgi:hypothetical protein